jgi:hypothetical protein
LACVFYAVGTHSFYLNIDVHTDVTRNAAVSWITGSNILELMPDKAIGLTWDELHPHYIAALYWTFTTITTVGYGDLIPQATVERLYAIFAMIFGTGLFGYIISTITTILQESYQGNVLMQAKFKALGVFMTEKNLPFDLQVRASQSPSARHHL